MQTIPLPGDGFWDYLAIDSDNRHIFVPRAGRVHVLNADTGAVVGIVSGMADGVHAVAVAPDQGVALTADSPDGTVTLFDLRTLKRIARIRLGRDPDTIIYDASSGHAFTFNNEQDSTVLDVAQRTVIKHIALQGRPEFAASDGAGQVYVNIVDAGELAVIDAHKAEIIARWPLAPCKGPTALSIDTAHARLFVSCRNLRMVVFDAHRGKIVADIPIGFGPDASRFDSSTASFFSSNGGGRPSQNPNGKGSLTVIHEDTPVQFTVVQTESTQPGARTMELTLNVPGSHCPFSLPGLASRFRSATARKCLVSLCITARAQTPAGGCASANRYGYLVALPILIATTSLARLRFRGVANERIS